MNILRSEKQLSQGKERQNIETTESTIASNLSDGSLLSVCQLCVAFNIISIQHNARCHKTYHCLLIINNCHRQHLATAGM